MSLAAAGAVLLAALLDRLVGEPPARLHPVALLGRVIDPLDRAWNSPFEMGVSIAVTLPVIVGAALGALVAVLVPLSLPVATVVAGLVLFSSTSLRMLLDEARAVERLLGEDTDAARERLRSLAGRDSDDLDASEVRSAAIESVAENLADGLVAPLVAFGLGALVSLPVAVGAAAFVKTVNTLDSMLGYPDKDHGTASARLDDIVMWLPARLSALLLAVAAVDPETPWRARSWVDRVPSPNSGWPMGTVAAALAVRLEKPGVYILNDVAPPPEAGDVGRAVRLVSRAGWLAWIAVILLLAYAGWF
ncbi:MAG: adenosylcobinamide-phosphate synthase CbiB [Halobacteriales archaeon]|nr:adenosylcobinamide-phosphate synthase CbiB [Halobacteriales archaeon]